MKALYVLMLIFLFSCSTSKMVQTDLYFGRLRLDGSTISNEEWNDFTTSYFNRYFHEGSTTMAATGTWFDKERQEFVNEQTFVVSYIHQKRATISLRIDSVRAAYKNTFQQQSVLRVDRKIRISF